MKNKNEISTTYTKETLIPIIFNRICVEYRKHKSICWQRISAIKLYRTIFDETVNDIDMGYTRKTHDKNFEISENKIKLINTFEDIIKKEYEESTNRDSDLWIKESSEKIYNYSIKNN